MMARSADDTGGAGNTGDAADVTDGRAQGIVVVDGVVVYPDHGLLTIPNLITLLRLCCLPIFLWLLFSKGDRVQAAILLSVLGATDWCDGYIARNFNQTSDFGKLFDPTADRILFFVAIGAIIADGSAPAWFCWIVLAREVVVAGITVVLTLRGVKPVDVTWFGKAATLCLMFAFPLWMGGSSTLSVASAMTAVAWCFAVPGLALSFYAAAAYVPKWRANLAEARAATA